MNVGVWICSHDCGGVAGCSGGDRNAIGSGGGGGGGGGGIIDSCGGGGGDSSGGRELYMQRPGEVAVFWPGPPWERTAPNGRTDGGKANGKTRLQILMSESVIGFN